MTSASDKFGSSAVQSHNVPICIQHVAVEQIKDAGLQCRTEFTSCAGFSQFCKGAPHKSIRERAPLPCQSSGQE